MKTLLSFIFLLFTCSQLQGQSLYPILLESYKHVNVYNYNNKTNIKEEIDISIKLRKITKKECKIISDALLIANFKFDYVSDTLLIATFAPDWVVGGSPISIFAKSSKSVMILEECNPYDGSIYKEMGLERKYPKGYPVIEGHGDADAFRDFYWGTLSKPSEQIVENFYSLMYHGNVDAFKEYYMNNMGRAYGVVDAVLRVVIKNSKVVPPTLIWIY